MLPVSRLLSVGREVRRGFLNPVFILLRNVQLPMRFQVDAKVSACEKPPRMPTLPGRSSGYTQPENISTPGHTQSENISTPGHTQSENTLNPGTPKLEDIPNPGELP